MDKTVIFIVIVIICVLCTVWSACVMAARADEQLREITYDKKELGGGGHQTMAATQIAGVTLQEAKERLLQVLEAYEEKK